MKALSSEVCVVVLVKKGGRLVVGGAGATLAGAAIGALAEALAVGAGAGVKAAGASATGADADAKGRSALRRSTKSGRKNMIAPTPAHTTPRISPQAKPLIHVRNFPIPSLLSVPASRRDVATTSVSNARAPDVFPAPAGVTLARD